MCVCVCVRVCYLGEQTFFLPGPPSRSLLGMGTGATDRERHENTKEEVRHCQDPKEEGWRGWQSCLATSQFPAEDGQILVPGLYMLLWGVGGREELACRTGGLEWEGYLSADPIWTLHSNT